MIKQNRRVPGTINSTPINKVKHSTFYNENSSEANERAGYPQPMQQVKKDKLATWKSNNLAESFANSEYGLIELSLKQRGIKDIEGSIDQTIKCHLVSVLDLSSNLLVNFPPKIFNKLSNLTKLYLNGNKLQKISFPYFKENKLKIIDISSNSLKSINLEHIDSLIKLQCFENQISFLTLPVGLQILNCRSNKLSNIYFMEHCYLLEEVDMSDNLLYDLKFNFKPYIKFRDEQQRKKTKNYEHLHTLDCSQNKIQFIEGMEYVPNLKVLMLSKNQIALTRHILNQLFLLQHLEELNFEDNPIQSAGFSEAELIETVLSRLHTLVALNGEDVCDFDKDASEKCYSTQRKSQFSGINEEPYQLFMDSHRKAPTLEKPFENMEWNFTLGDCQNQPKSGTKIQELSEIQIVNHQIHQNQAHQHRGPQFQQLTKTDFDQTYHFGLLNKKDKEIKIKILKSASPMVPQHVYYQQFLKTLLPMSYIPSSTLLLGADYTSGRRLDCEDDEYILFDKMFSNRGGVAYVKKISKWIILQNEKEIFGKHASEPTQSSLGFLLNDTSEQQFRELSKYNKLIRRGEKDIMGMQPNAFTYFHTVVRHVPQTTDEYYQCVYLIQTFQL